MSRHWPGQAVRNEATDACREHLAPPTAQAVIACALAVPRSSEWKQKALRHFEEQGIYQVGRYGRWVFQGIADSIRDGFLVGASLKNYT